MTRSLGLEELYVKELDEQMETLSLALLSGSPTDFAEYKHMVGQYRSLAVAKNRFIDLVKLQEVDE